MKHPTNNQLKRIYAGIALIGFGCGVALSAYSTEVFNRVNALLTNPTILIGTLCAVIVYLIIYDVLHHEANYD